jgi:hypothetical protein
MGSIISPATVLAYRQTHYRVFGSIPAVLRVGVYCAPLLRLFQLHHTDCAAFVTACNPLGARLDAACNAQRQATLAQEIARQGRVACDGIGEDPSGEWPGEPSLLVLGLARSAAQALGRQFQQNAILWAAADAIPELILLR